MLQSFGAGFFVLTLLSVLALFAVVGSVVAFVALVLQDLGDSVERVLHGVALLLVIVVLAITVFGALVTYDEAPAALWIFVGTVVLPIALVALDRSRERDWSTLDGLATAALAWAPAFVIGVAVLWGLVARTDVAFTGATAIAGGVTVLGSVLVGRQLRQVDWLRGPA